MANIDRIYIQVPADETYKNVSVRDATDSQFDWWVGTWERAGAFTLEHGTYKDGTWTLQERSDLIDQMRKLGISITEVTEDNRGWTTDADSSTDH
jgi:hypothetical protein